MVRRIWLIFAQATTLALAALFVVLTFKPHWVANLGSGSEPAGSGELGLREGGAPIAAHGYREAAARAMPAVVYIYTTQKVAVPNHPLLNDPTFRKFFRDQPEREPTAGLGSGVIVSEKGYVLTNHHVVSGAEQIEVGLADGRRAGAILVGTDPDTDLAVLKISLNRLPVIAFGRPTEARVGDTVLAIGNPFGVGQTVTQGIISAMGRSRLGINTYENFIQTDAAINPGNSGGALIDTQGQLLGINTAIYTRSGGNQGIGFAIPADTARMVMEALVTKGKVSRGYIGVEPRDAVEGEGCLIAGVLRSGPADEAGIRPGDVVISVNDRPIRNMTELTAMVAAIAPGSKAKFKVRRQDQVFEASVSIAERPAIAEKR
ncbi:MAG: trypsin-like peptidase domain-containing protein [Burkholderiaceae bacterium]